ncbi:hypothetical protein SK128_017996, partial [Halocaridina rubra]
VLAAFLITRPKFMTRIYLALRKNTIYEMGNLEKRCRIFLHSVWNGSKVSETPCPLGSPGHESGQTWAEEDPRTSSCRPKNPKSGEKRTQNFLSRQTEEEEESTYQNITERALESDFGGAGRPPRKAEMELNMETEKEEEKTEEF